MATLDPRRSQNVGASEMGALFSAAWADEDTSPDDLDPYETRFALHHRKAGNLTEERKTPASFTGKRPALRNRLLFGNVLEAGIARAISESLEWKMEPGGFVLHPTVPGMSSTPDFLAVAPDLGDIIAETKNVDRHRFKKWPERTEPGVFWWQDDEWRPAEIQPPFSMKLQVQAQLACKPELSAAVIAPLVGGNELYLFRIDRHPGVIARIEAEVVACWDAVRAAPPPAPDWQLDGDTLVALLGMPDPGMVADLRGNPEALELAREYAAFRDQEKTAERLKKGHKARLLWLIGKAERARFDQGFNLWAGEIRETFVEGYVRVPYRGFQLTQSKK